MPTEKTIPEILRLARIAQPLANNDSFSQMSFRGGALDKNLGLTIFMERRSIQWRYDKDPSDPTLRASAEYLYALLGKYAIMAEDVSDNIVAGPPTVSGPADQNLNISGTASFTIVPASSIPYTVQWFRNGILVPGATSNNYSFAATTADNGHQVYAVVTNAVGSAQSRIATLTVTNNIAAFFWFGDEDPYPDLAAGQDTLDYQIQFNISSPGSGFVIVDIPEGASNNRYNVTKYPKSQGIMIKWVNTPLNQGLIPDSVYHSIVEVGNYYYVISREAMSFDHTSNLILSTI